MTLRGGRKRAGRDDGRQAALRLLGRREYSARQLRQALKERGLDGGDTDRLLADLQEQGLQSDRRYAELLVRSRLAQGYGAQRITAEAARDGVDDATLAQALEEAAPDWDALLVNLQRRHFRGPPRSRADLLAQARYLLGRGHSAERVWRLLRAEDEA